MDSLCRSTKIHQFEFEHIIEAKGAVDLRLCPDIISMCTSCVLSNAHIHI